MKICRWAMTLLVCVGCMGHVQAKAAAVFIISDNTLEDTTLGNIRKEINELPDFPYAFGYNQVRLVDFIVDKMTDYFRVDRKTNLLTARALDRDRVCSLIGCCQLTICSVKFRVLISASQSSVAPILKSVEVLLMDLNDQAPQFSPMSSLHIAEATPIGTQFALPEAKDGESLENSVQSYNLQDESFTFGLIMKESRPFIKILRPLDYEKQQNYRLTLLANDKIFTATTTLSVAILDVNDNAPVFQESRKSVTILENQKTDQSFVQVNATDIDSGQNAHISYAIEDVNPTNMASFFQINANTGHVSLLKSMDYEDEEIAKSTQLTITAQDAGLPRRSASTVLVVLLNGIDDHAPIIRSIMNYKLQEESGEKQLVQIFSVRDPDQSGTVGLSCNLVPSMDSRVAHFQLIRRGGSSGASLLFDLYSTSAVNYELNPTVSATVVCTDGLSNSQQTFNISVQEINEFAPQFSAKMYTTSIVENLNVDWQVLRVHASDKDSGDAGQVLYKITKPADFHYFRVDERSGDVSVNAPLDREDTSFVSFTITATDFPGYPEKQQFSSAVVVNITLLDVNDVTPTYKGATNLRVVENQPIGHEVAKLDFEDRDAGQNGSVHLSLLMDGNLANNLFELSSGGSLRTKQMLDRETQSFLYIQVVASDGGLPSLSATVTLIINVEDENDNAPRLLSPAENETLSFALNSSAKSNTKVTQLRGTDADAPGTLNSKLQFTLLPSNGSSYFYLNKSSGLLTTKWGVDQVLMPPSPGIYELRVYLQDSAPRAPMHQITVFKIEIFVSTSGSIVNGGTTNGLLILIFIVFTTAIIAFILLWLIWRTRREGIHHRNLGGLVVSTEHYKIPPQQFVSPIVTASPTGTRLIRPLEEDSYCKEDCHYTALTPIASYNHCVSQNCYGSEYGRMNEELVEYSNHSLSRPRITALAPTKFSIQHHERSGVRCPSIQSFGEVEADSGRGGSAEDLRCSQINSYTSLPTARFNTFQTRLKAAALPPQSSLIQPPYISLNDKKDTQKETETRI